jgi:hypothetical protein
MAKFHGTFPIFFSSHGILNVHVWQAAQYTFRVWNSDSKSIFLPDADDPMFGQLEAEKAKMGWKPKVAAQFLQRV